MNELDADKYLNTEPKRTKDLLEAENLKLKKELKELKMQYALQLIRAQELIDKILDTIQVDNVTKNRPVSSCARPGSASTKKATKESSAQLNLSHLPPPDKLFRASRDNSSS